MEVGIVIFLKLYGRKLEASERTWLRDCLDEIADLILVVSRTSACIRILEFTTVSYCSLPSYVDHPVFNYARTGSLSSA